MRTDLAPPIPDSTTAEEDQSLAYAGYATRPHLYAAATALDSGILAYEGGTVCYQPPDGAPIRIAPAQQYDLVEATLFGLNEALVRAEAGAGLRDAFEDELACLRTHLDTYGDARRYGTYAYYPGSGELVHYAPAAAHRLSLVTSNARLLQDPALQLSWHAVRARLEAVVVAVAGASVGNNIAHTVAMDLRPRQLKIADLSFFKVSNANRVRLTYRDIVCNNAQRRADLTPFGLKNKAIGAAEQVHALDPYMEVWAYYEGVNRDNVRSFVGGNRVEPRATYVVEETDNPDAKVLIREEARRQRVRLVMATDLGSAVQMDIRPFDQDPTAPLAFGAMDAELYARQQAAHHQPGNREVFWRFVDSLIGAEYRTRGEFGHTIAGRLPRLVTSIPQIGSTAMMAGGIVAEVLARLTLGFRYPERFLVDKRTLELVCWGEWV